MWTGKINIYMSGDDSYMLAKDTSGNGENTVNEYVSKVFKEVKG